MNAKEIVTYATAAAAGTAIAGPPGAAVAIGIVKVTQSGTKK